MGFRLFHTFHGGKLRRFPRVRKALAPVESGERIQAGIGEGREIFRERLGFFQQERIVKERLEVRVLVPPRGK